MIPRSCIHARHQWPVATQVAESFGIMDLQGRYGRRFCCDCPIALWHVDELFMFDAAPGDSPNSHLTLSLILSRLKGKHPCEASRERMQLFFKNQRQIFSRQIRPCAGSLLLNGLLQPPGLERSGPVNRKRESERFAR